LKPSGLFPPTGAIPATPTEGIRILPASDDAFDSGK
jgi:hypothetical protein